MFVIDNHVSLKDQRNRYLLYIALKLTSCFLFFFFFFPQILVRLCNYTSPAEELARKDDLSLLFSAITSWCPTHNAIWRQSAGEVLVTLSRHGLTPQVVNYIHGWFFFFFFSEIF